MVEAARLRAVGVAETVAATAAAAALPAPAAPPASGPDEAVIEGLSETPPPPAATMTLDQPLLATVDAAIDEADVRFLDALAAQEGLTAPDRAALGAALRQALAPAIGETTADAAQAAATALGGPGGVSERRRLTEGVVAALAADPAVAGADFDPARTLGPLDGLAYPFERLMRAAVASHPVSLPEAAASVAAQSRRTVAEGPRVTGDYAGDCGCVAPHRENATVYAFYPFWLSDPVPDPVPDPASDPAQPDAGADADAGTPAARAAAASVQSVNFEVIERLAFDAMRIDADGVLRGRRLWTAAAPHFVYAARKRQAAPDVAVRLRGWTAWGADGARSVDAIAEALLLAMEPVAFPEIDAPLRALEAAVDRQFLTLRPAGVTLVLEHGAGAPPRLENVLLLAARLRRELPPETYINLAMDLQIDAATAAAQTQLFQRIGPTMRGGDAMLFDFVLVFLQRDTSASKKTLRDIVEDAFHGEQRKRVLRSIIPVLPAGGHVGVPSADPAMVGDPLGQFRDDVIYFQDNFGGIGLWPTPDAERDGAIEAIVADIFSAGRGVEANAEATSQERVLTAIRAGMAPVCDITCPRRFAIYALMIVIAASLAVAAALAPFLGFFERLVRDYYAVPIHLGLLMILLLLTETCDNPSYSWALFGFLAVLALSVGLLVVNWMNRNADGPEP